MALDWKQRPGDGETLAANTTVGPQRYLGSRAGATPPPSFHVHTRETESTPASDPAASTVRHQVVNAVLGIIRATVARLP